MQVHPEIPERIPAPDDGTRRPYRERMFEPEFQFSALAVLTLIVIWWGTLHLIHVERAAAESSAMTSTRELTETYEAQVVRTLGEIDQTLKVVKYAYEVTGAQRPLLELSKRVLLPPELLFEVSIANSKGEIVGSTHPSATTPIADRETFQAQRQSDLFTIGLPQRSAGRDDLRLHFSRRLNAPDGSFAGVAVVAVDAAYFVSGYETSKLGKRGVLGVLGVDGAFRARRSGDVVAPLDIHDYGALAPPADQDSATTNLSVNAWDGVRRYTGARRLYDFPLAVIVGLSEDEQLEGARRNARNYVWRAGLASALTLFVAALLVRLSRQLARSRERVVEGQIAHAERVEYLAYHDALTTLPNRSLFSKLLEQGVQEARRYEKQLAVLFLDLDRFKQVNDTLGHAGGDELLREVACRLKGCLRESDAVARLGGDEFVVLLPLLNDQKYVASVAQKILDAVARPFTLAGQEFRVTASVGISIYPQDGLDEQTLTKNADIAMYQAKGEGKNNFQFFSETLNANSLERLTLDSGLRHAVERSEFTLHYQPKRNVRSGRITGLEALLRWQHPDLGLIAPMHFIPIAEETGLTVPIGKWVLRTACQQQVAWQAQGGGPIPVSVNLTARQFFDERLLPDLQSTLASTGMEASMLELEIAENLLMHDRDKTFRVLGGLKAMGVRIAIDDFGIGYSSLAAFQKFPIDTIKIDRSFVRDLTDPAADMSLVEAVIAMGRTLSLSVVAKGIETSEQAALLRGDACTEYQGFYLDMPMPADQISSLLQERTKAPTGAP